MSIVTARIVFTPSLQKSIASIPIDVFEEETYTRDSSMTAFPIEDGSTISEHIVNMPKEVGMKGFVGASDFSQGEDYTQNYLASR